MTCVRGLEGKVIPEIKALSAIIEKDDVEKLAEKDKSLEGDFEAALQAELAQLHSQKRRLNVVSLGKDVQCIQFIKMDDPVGWLQRVFAHLAANPHSFTAKSAQRILPVQKFCQAHLNDLIATAKPLISAYFPHGKSGETVSWAVCMESRYNASLDKAIVTRALADLIPKQHRVNLKSPQLVLLVQVVKGVVGLSVVCNYHEWKRFNVGEWIIAHRSQKSTD